MNLLGPLGRLTATTVRVLTLAAALTGTAHTATAQTTSGATRPQAALPKRIYTKTSEFKLPIQMDDKTRANLDRVCLYVKSGDAAWVRQEVGPATMPYFLYRVPQDGEYLFSLTTIDKTGKMSPADVSQEPPSLRVMVDTKAPMLDVQPWDSPQGELCLRCNIVDANPDPASLKLVAKMPGGDRALLPYPGQPGVFKTSGPEMMTVNIVVTASDLSGNQATREIRLRELPASTVQATQLQTPATSSTSAKVELPPPAPRVELPAPPPLPMIPLSESTPVTLPPAPPLPLAANNPVIPATNPALPVNHPAPPAITSPRPDLDLPPRTPAAAMNKQVINTTRAILDYRVDQVGPSGVGKVEVYLTTDEGQSWQRLGEDPDRRSPVEFDLPGEGLFGIRLAVTNGNGFGGTPPQRGDRPTCWVEVDTSAPFIQLRPIDPVVANGTLEIRWQATDKNLGPEPVSLYYRNRNDGPWQVIARGVKNDGSYRWAFPRDASAQFFVKVEVTDLAGNTARVETPNPVVLDMTEPHATVIGVTGLSVRPGGN